MSESDGDWVFGPYEHLYSMVQNKMASARLGFELRALAITPDQADVAGGPGDERDPAQTPSAKGGPSGSY